MKKIYIIAHTWRDLDLTIEYHFTPGKVIKSISELISDECIIKVNTGDDPEEYIQRYHKWAKEDNDNMCDVNIELKIIEL